MLTSGAHANACVRMHVWRHFVTWFHNLKFLMEMTAVYSLRKTWCVPKTSHKCCLCSYYSRYFQFFFLCYFQLLFVFAVILCSDEPSLSVTICIRWSQGWPCLHIRHQGYRSYESTAAYIEKSCLGTLLYERATKKTGPMSVAKQNSTSVCVFWL